MQRRVSRKLFEWKNAPVRWGIFAVAFCLLFTGCSIKRMAVNRLGNALAESGGTFASDDDPELIKAAVPFSLKLMESLLAEVPEHEGLLFATSSGFTQYSYAFVQLEADQLEEEDFDAALEMKQRAKRLYLRARNYGLRGLDARHEGLSQELYQNPDTTVLKTDVKDVRMLYWTAVSWAGAISLSKNDADMIADLPIVEALIYRALDLDESYDHGAIHTFLITFEQSRQVAEGDPVERSRRHYNRALELSGGRQIAPLVAYAEAVCVPQQDRHKFEELLRQALEFNPDTYPENRLVNLIMQRRARWLLTQTENLFLD